jgi:hypothetical protein
MFNKDIRSFIIKPNETAFIPAIIFALVAVIIQIFVEESITGSNIYSGIMSTLIVIMIAYYLLIGRNSLLIIREEGQ